MRIFLEQEQHLVWDRIQQDFHQPNKAEYLALITVEQQSAIECFLQFVIDYGKDYNLRSMEQINYEL